MGLDATSPAAPRVRWRRVATYYLAVLGITYGLLAIFLLRGGSFQDASWVLFANATSLTPALVAMLLTRLLWREPLRASLALRLRPIRWLLVAWALPWGLALVALGLGLLLPDTRWDATLQPAVDRVILAPEQLDLLRGYAAAAGLPPVLLLVPFGLAASLSLSFVSGCGEEIGWRGFLHTELRPLGLRWNALLTGLLWLGWHLPLLACGYGYPEHPGLGALLMSAHLLTGAFCLAYLRERAASSLACGLFHGTTEAVALLAIAPLAGGSDLTVGVGSITWIAADLLVLLALLAHDRFLARASLFWPRKAPRGGSTPPGAQPGYLPMM